MFDATVENGILGACKRHARWRVKRKSVVELTQAAA